MNWLTAPWRIPAERSHKITFWDIAKAVALTFLTIPLVSATLFWLLQFALGEDRYEFPYYMITQAFGFITIVGVVALSGIPFAFGFAILVKRYGWVGYLTTILAAAISSAIIGSGLYLLEGSMVYIPIVAMFSGVGALYGLLGAIIIRLLRRDVFKDST